MTPNDLEIITRYPTRPLKILISGASGMVGTSLSVFLTDAGHKVVKLVRREPKNDHEIFWDPDTGELDGDRVDGFDAWINLSGENIAGRRWTDDFKQKLFSSRVSTTGLLAKTINNLFAPPTVFISASAIGFYGNRGDELLNENSGPGADFLVDLTRRWEDEAMAALSATRVVLPRFGVILSPKGGALKKMLLPFKLGVGGIIGSGDQYMSWIALDDVIYGIYHALVTNTLRGPVNFVASRPVTNREFVKALGNALNRPTILPLPAVIVKAIFGEMGERLLLASQRVSNDKLLKSGFIPCFQSLEEALSPIGVRKT